MNEDNKLKLIEEKDNQSAKSHKKKNRYKIIVGNGCHKAVCDVQGMLVPSPEQEGKFLMILPDGLQLNARLRSKRLHLFATKYPNKVLGMHWFRCYPKFMDHRLVGLQIIKVDRSISENRNGKEYWEFIGAWTAQNNITVQRSIALKQVRKIAKENGFIKRYRYTFTNSLDFKQSLWVGYVYQIIAQRDGDQLKIRKVIPFASPRFKPKASKNEYEVISLP